MPLHILQCTGQPHSKELSGSKVNSLVGVEKSWLSSWGLHLSQQHWRAYEAHTEQRHDRLQLLVLVMARRLRRKGERPQDVPEAGVGGTREGFCRNGTNKN